jgi:hypothetical protein
VLVRVLGSVGVMTLGVTTVTSARVAAKPRSTSIEVAEELFET